MNTIEVGFKEKFLELLEEEYPEKVLTLIGMEFDDSTLSNYVTEYSLDQHTFDPNKFKLVIQPIFVDYDICSMYAVSIVKDSVYKDAYFYDKF